MSGELGASVGVAGGGGGAIGDHRELLRLRSHSVCRGGRVLLSGLDLSLRAGQTVAILGESGCGKSSLLQDILEANIAAQSSAVSASAAQRAAGAVTDSAAANPDSAAERSIAFAEGVRVAYLQQNPMLFEQFSAAENVALPLRIAGLPRANRDAAALRALAALDAEHLAERRSWQLSGGEAQRVALARALAQPAEILLLDEPFSALDYLAKERLQRALAGALAASGRAALLITHDAAEAAFLASEVFIVRRGRLARSERSREAILHALGL